MRFFAKQTKVNAALSSEQLVRAYGKILEDHASELIRDPQILPASIEDIGVALLDAISKTRDVRTKEMLRVGFLELATFHSLSESEKRELHTFGSDKDFSNESNLLELADSIVEDSDSYIELQDRILTKQANLMLVLKKFEARTTKMAGGHHAPR
jgi:hypothetical protein